MNVKGKPPVDCGYSGNVRAPVVPHISYAKSFMVIDHINLLILEEMKKKK
ncbi:hypothetical protein HanIR_Chr13g0630401 [Helianthus annuus]|nr:hypothetical protein HanIR_Chr13g0630401 [Helianthus annuus]